ncbi:hypothetical protein [Geothrix sp. 21YS21S-2]|nr:hypothetical protein [Geothrix sp. 21YS21S-2]
MHFHPSFHPFQKHPVIPAAYVANLVLILLGILVALALGPLRMD